MTSTDLVALRRALHRIPELGFEERRTSEHLGAFLSAFADPRPIAGTGLAFDLGPASAERTLLLRADMDGLPIDEETGLPFASAHPGRMHACGHDAHMAALAVAAGRLAGSPPPGLRVRVLFQPAEEGCGGAERAIDEGVLDGVDLAFGLHVWNELPLGTVVATPGGVMAGVVELGLEVKGRGGHGAMPDRTRDPVVAAAQLVLALQTVVSRRTPPLDGAVLSLGAIYGGDAFNAIPDRVELRGTVRAFSDDEDRRLEDEVRRVARGIGEATGTDIGVTWLRHTRATVNDRAAAALVAEAARGVPGVRTVLSDYRTMAGEDFGEVLARVPGCYALVGSADPALPHGEPHHSPRFEIDERVLDIACALHGAVARRFAEGA